MQERTALLIGEAGAARLAARRVAVVGLGGVGGHCAGALARMERVGSAPRMRSPLPESHA